MSMRRSLFAARRLDRVRVRLAALWAVLLAPGQGQQGRQEWALAQAPPVAARLAYFADGLGRMFDHKKLPEHEEDVTT